MRVVHFHCCIVLHSGVSHNLFILSTGDGHLRSFNLGAITESAVTNILACFLQGPEVYISVGMHPGVKLQDLGIFCITC